MNISAQSCGSFLKAHSGQELGVASTVASQSEAQPRQLSIASRSAGADLLNPDGVIAAKTTFQPVDAAGESPAPDTRNAVYEDPRVALREEQKRRQERVAKQEEAEVQEEIARLSKRDREVRAHEQAHMAVGGQYAGAASYDFKRGPNGVNYAVGGEVPISTSPESTPEQTLSKARIIRAAALAPAEPSPQDRRVAAMATQMEAKARSEIAEAQKEEELAKSEKTAEAAEVEKPSTDKSSKDVEPSEAVEPVDQPPSGRSNADSVRIFFTSAEESTGLLLSDHA